MFQSVEEGSNRLATHRLEFARVGGPIGAVGLSRLSQGSDQTEISFPFPTTQPRPCRRTSLPASIPLQPWEAEAGAVHSKKEEFKQYLPSSVCASREWGSFRILQASFAKRASLNCSISLKPKPPAPFGRVSLFHETQQSLRTDGFTSHQKRVKTL